MTRTSDMLRKNPALNAIRAEVSLLEKAWNMRRPPQPKPQPTPTEKPNTQPVKETQASRLAHKALLEPLPKRNCELRDAKRIADNRGDHDLALSYARLHVPQSLQYTVEALAANASRAKGDETRWLLHLNSYLSHLGLAPVRLNAGGALLDRFATDHIPKVVFGPLISVIMPAWNAEKTIPAAAQSILNQTWQNLELLIVDDASEDGTWAQMQALAASDSRVRIFRNKANVGPYVSKNMMVSMARGEWITGHDADDWAHPQRLANHITAVLQKKNPPRASATFMLRLDGDGYIERINAISNYSFDGVARLAAISCMFETSFLRQELGGWDNVRFGGDSEMISRTQVLIGEEFTKYPQVSMLCMNLEGSLPNNATHGISKDGTPSQIRLDYSAAYAEWHKNLASGQASARLSFPPSLEAARPFDAPGAATVSAADIWRNLDEHKAHGSHQ